MAAPTVTPTASAEKFDMPPYVVALAAVLPWGAGIAGVMKTTGAPLAEALLPGAVLGIAIVVALLLLAPVLMFLVIPALSGVVTAGGGAAPRRRRLAAGRRGRVHFGTPLSGGGAETRRSAARVTPPRPSTGTAHRAPSPRPPG